MSDEAWTWRNRTLKEGWVLGAVDRAHLAVVTEQPRSKDGRFVPMRGNRWYPTMVRFGGLPYMDDSVTLMTDDARLIAKALIKAADIADAYDAQHSDSCGHWSPCTCAVQKAKGER